MPDPIHQFEIRDLFPIAKIGNTEIAFTNSAAYMFVAVALITAFLVGGTARRGLVPGRVQSMVELTYEFNDCDWALIDRAYHLPNGETCHVDDADKIAEIHHLLRGRS